MISKHVITTAGLACVSFLIAGGLVAQQQTTPSPNTKQQMKAKMQEKMKGGGMMGQMMAQREEMSQLMSKLKDSMTAVKSEKNPGALQTKIAEHAALLDTLAAKMSAQQSMMDNMMQTMMAPENGKAAK